LNARLKRPLLAVVVSSALLAGGLAVGTPAFADERDSATEVASVLADEPTPSDPTTPPVDETTPEPSDSASPTPSEPAPSEPVPSEPVPGDPPTSATPEPSETTTPPPSEEPSTPPSEDPTTPPPAPDTQKPTGSFSLNTGAIWMGQRVTLTQGTIKDNQPVADVKRVVSWGDGTSSTLKAGQAPINKQYTVAKTYTIKFTITDKAGNANSYAKTLKVTKPGTWKPSAYNVWPGQKITWKLTGVPAGTTKIWFDWGDGYKNWISGKNQSFSGLYYHRLNGGLIKGKVTVRATFYNKYGASSALYVTQINVKTDSWAPTVKVTKPAKSTSAKAWRTVKGTVADKGAGTPYVYVWVSRIVGSKVYCYTPQKKWKRVYTQEQYNDCDGLTLKPSKGKWSVKLSSLPKGGTIYVDAITWDWADRQSKWSSVKGNISKA
jgi:hypothetical protein